MDIKQERKGIKKEVAAYLLVATIMFISIFILHSFLLQAQSASSRIPMSRHGPLKPS